MKLVKLKLENFLTYEKLEYNFEDRALLVQGINLTDKNQKSNGSGKSAIQTGIEFALTASNSRGVNDAELITYGYDNSSVELFVKCDSRKEVLHIDWTINSKGSNKLSLKLNDKDISFSNINDGKKQILDWLAISKEDLFNYFIINSTRFKSFFGSSNREKVDLINRFSDSSIIDGLENIDNSQFDGEKLDIENKINKLDGKLELLEEQIQKEKNKDFTKELSDEKESLLDEIDLINQKIKTKEGSLVSLGESEFEIKNEIKDLEKSIVKFEGENKIININILEQEGLIDIKRKDRDISKLKIDNFKYSNNSVDIKTIEDKIKVKESDIKKAEGDIFKINKFVEGLDVKLSGKIDCPKCSHTFVLDGDIEIMITKKSQGEDLIKKYNKNLNKFIEDKEILDEQKRCINKLEEDELEELSSLKSILSDVRETLNDFEDTLSSIKNKSLKTSKKILNTNEEIRELNHELKENSLDKKRINKRLIELKGEIVDIQNEIKNLKVSDNKDAIDELIGGIRNIGIDKKSNELELIKVNDIIYNRNKWANNFKQFRLHLANKSLETMQYQTNKFLKELGNDIVVRLDGYKVKANGTIKEEISAVIIRDGERTFSSLSGGEQVRVLFSSILANRHLINTTHPHGGLDFLSVDEVFDKIDSVGMKYLIRSAKKLETCIMVISHVSDEDLSGEEILTIVKENGVSTIKK